MIEIPRLRRGHDFRKVGHVRRTRHRGAFPWRNLGGKFRALGLRSALRCTFRPKRRKALPFRKCLAFQRLALRCAVYLDGRYLTRTAESEGQAKDTASQGRDNSSISPIERGQPSDTAKQRADSRRTSPSSGYVPGADSSLDFLIQNWSALPGSIRDSILTIARAVVGQNGGAHE